MYKGVCLFGGGWVGGWAVVKNCVTSVVFLQMIMGSNVRTFKLDHKV